MDGVGAVLLGVVGGWSAMPRAAGVAAWLALLALAAWQVPALLVPLAAGVGAGAAAHGGVRVALRRRVA